MHKNKINLRECMNFSNFDKTEFLNNYWEKKPTVIKGAVPNAESLASIEDLTELALDSDFESRMIIQSGGDYPWQLKHGPFTIEDFSGHRLQTLICHRINLLHKNFFSLAQMVNFIPNWQFDDVMATVSEDGATCGAHIDNYNVFILQGQGKRRWQLQSNPNTAYQEGLDVRLLKEFIPDQEVILEPGDILYIPPKVAHNGISMGKSISYSIGFKALEYANFLDFFTTFLMQTDFNEFYANPEQSALQDPFEVTKQDLDKVKTDMLSKVFGNAYFEDALCSFLSRATAVVEPQVEDEKEVKQFFKENIPFGKDQGTQFLYYAGKLYCNSVPFELSRDNYQKLLPLIKADLDTAFSRSQFGKIDKQLEQILLKLLLNGDLYFVE